MEIYLLKSVACLGILYLFYKLVLENSSLHTTKRFYLLAILVASFLIPLITVTEYVEVDPVISETATQFAVTTIDPSMATETRINYLPYILGAMYILGVFVFSLRFGRNLLNVFHKAQKNPSLKKHTLIHVLLKLPVTPHSFFNYIFFNKTAYETGAIPQEVIDHETAHVLQKHSWDIVFFEILRIVFWFNPLLYFIKRSIKLNHEFMADRAVLTQGADPVKYQNILLNFSSPDSYRDPSFINLAHSINYSSIKKRFTVMKTQTSKRAAWFKAILVLPLLAILIFGFSSKDTVVTNNTIPSNNTENYTRLENEVLNQKATPKQIETYNQLAKKYNAVPIAERKIGRVDLKILENIYRLMDTDQKKQALPFPECLPEHQSYGQKGHTEAFTIGAVKNQNKNLVILVNASEISINGTPSSLKTFARDLDAVTKSWEETDYTSVLPTIKIASTPDSFLKKLDAEFRKTHFSKANGGIGLVPPPPPAPEAPRVVQKKNGGQANIPPPPPPPSPVAPKVLKGVNDGEPNIPPPPPPAPKVYKDGDNPMKVPPPPQPNSKFNFESISLKMTLFDPPDFGPQTDTKNPQTLLDLMVKHNAPLFFSGSIIEKEAALILIKAHSNIEIVVEETPHDKTSVVFSTHKKYKSKE